METYVTIHDQDLLLACESEGRFDALSHTYLFVGSRPVDKVPADVKLVVSRDYSDGYEYLPQFYDFTGWHTLAKHRLVPTGSKICLLQYDHRVLDPNAEEVLEDALTRAPMVSTVAGYYNNWFLIVGGFEPALVEACRVCGMDLRAAEAAAPFDKWPSTQGTAWQAETFVDFMTWFEPAFQSARGHVLAGHIAERMVQAYMLHTGTEVGYSGGLFSHDSLDCHGTGDFMRGDLGSYARKKAAFEEYQSS